jgi:hypothetical protein
MKSEDLVGKYYWATEWHDELNDPFPWKLVGFYDHLDLFDGPAFKALAGDGKSFTYYTPNYIGKESNKKEWQTAYKMSKLK